MKILVTLGLVLILSACTSDPFLARFDGLQPIATHNDYAIYDLVVQRQWACAEAIEFLDEDANYQYYFPCLKSEHMYLVSAQEVIKLKHAYAAGLIDVETLYRLDLVERMPK